LLRVDVDGGGGPATYTSSPSLQTASVSGTVILRRGDAATIKLVHADCKLPSGCTCAKTTARAPVARQ